MRRERSPGSSLVRTLRYELRASSTQSSRAWVSFLDPLVPRAFLGSQMHLAAGTQTPAPQAGELHTRLLLEVPPSGSAPLVSHTWVLLGHPGAHRASRQLQLPVPQAHTSGSPWRCGPPLPTAVASSWLLPGDPFLPASLLLPGVTPQISFLRPDVHPRLHLHRTPNHGIRLDKITHCGRFLPQVPIAQNFQASVILPKSVLSKFLLFDKLKGAEASS